MKEVLVIIIVIAGYLTKAEVRRKRLAGALPYTFCM